MTVEAYLVTILGPKGPFSFDGRRPVFRFAYMGSAQKAHYLAGKCIDQLADYFGLGFDYRVELIHHHYADWSDSDLVDTVFEKAKQTQSTWR